jgi:hypothetical protein
MNSKCFLIIIVLLSIISCWNEPEDVYNRLDRTDWFKYNVNDTLMFKNSSTTFDTYIVKTIDTFFWAYHEHTFNEVLTVTYEKLPECNSCPIEFFNRAVNSVSFGGKLYSSNFNYPDSAFECTLGDTILHKIYLFEDFPTNDTIYHKVKAIYYSDVFGVIRYNMHDDRVYELQLE